MLKRIAKRHSCLAFQQKFISALTSLANMQYIGIGLLYNKAVSKEIKQKPVTSFGDDFKENLIS